MRPFAYVCAATQAKPAWPGRVPTVPTTQVGPRGNRNHRGPACEDADELRGPESVVRACAVAACQQQDEARALQDGASGAFTEFALVAVHCACTESTGAFWSQSCCRALVAVALYEKLLLSSWQVSCRFRVCGGEEVY